MKSSWATFWLSFIICWWASFRRRSRALIRALWFTICIYRCDAILPFWLRFFNSLSRTELNARFTVRSSDPNRHKFMSLSHFSTNYWNIGYTFFGASWSVSASQFRRSSYITYSLRREMFSFSVPNLSSRTSLSCLIIWADMLSSSERDWSDN